MLVVASAGVVGLIMNPSPEKRPSYASISILINEHVFTLKLALKY